jgi:hypothetical protein
MSTREGGREARRTRWCALLGLRPSHQRERLCGHELCSLVHGGRTSVRALRKHRGREAGSEREWGNALVLLGLAKRERGEDARQRSGGTARAQSPREVVHCDIQLNRWQAMEWPTWDTVLGWLRADLDFGLLTKFEARSNLYDFPLGSKVIRAVD